MKKPHIPILKSFDELPFNIGKKSLVDFVKGNPNPTIDKNNLSELNSYGCLYMLDLREVFSIIDWLISKNLLQLETINGGFQVVKRTLEGGKEAYDSKLDFDISKVGNKDVNISFKGDFDISRVTKSDRKLFTQFDFFLNKYNEEQKKAIISNEKNILCIAGAGTGKTTVLTKRIEFLKKFKSVDESNILAITFTRKAKQEMESRLKRLDIKNVSIETFNSFCEKLLQKYEDLVYGENEVRVATFSDKIRIIRNVMDKLSINLDSIADDYFNKKQLRDKSGDELFFVFVNDIFTIIDFYKNEDSEMIKFFELEKNSVKRRVSKAIYEIAHYTEIELKKRHLRDFSDQILDVLKLFKENKNIIPKFKHILVDEFQDLNKVQYELLKLLGAENNFAVGDPRQAIYGWRGSEVKYVIDYPKEFTPCEVISLNKNYRSNSDIVSVFNEVIKPMKLDDLEANNKVENNSLYLIEQDNEKLERIFVAEAIKKSENKNNEIFVLARTNRILDNFADTFSQMGIDYVVKSEEDYKQEVEPTENQVILATVHSIKGMEAKEVYVVNANTLSYPNRVADNYVLSLVKKSKDYDKEDEELRLFYVALSRAKEKLVISYTGNLTKFISSEMLSLFETRKKNKSLFDSYKKENLSSGNSVVLKNMLKSWRTDLSERTGLPTYMIISNNAIEDIVIKRPQTKWDLESINGLGPAKIAKYGDELLKIVKG